MAPWLWGVVAFVFAFAMIIGLMFVVGPFVLALIVAIALFAGWDLLFLEDALYKSLSERGGIATVGEITEDVGYSPSSLENCKFATCRLYSELTDLSKSGAVLVFDADGLPTNFLDDDSQVIELIKED